MADAPDPTGIPEAAAVAPKRWPISLVWLIPLIVALIGAWLAAQAILERGPTITIRFKSAEGLEAGKTRIKYKSVDIGEVKSIGLSEDRSTVIVTAQLAKQAEKFLVEDTRFWIVRPRIAGGSVSGLTTLLSGSYIGVDVGKSQTEKSDFVGLETPPVVTRDLPGRQFVLHGDDVGSLDIGSPVFFRRIEVGQVVAFELDKDGKGVTLKVFINAPYDQYVTTGTQFWHASGLDFTLDASGIRVDTQSLSSLLVGGIAFQAPPDASLAEPAQADRVFRLSADRDQAMKAPDTVAETYVMIFRESVRGLVAGAPVDFRGVVVGEVVSINIDYDRAHKEFTMAVEVRLFPDRLRSKYRKSAKEEAPEPKALLQRMIEHGFRGQLRTGSLLTQQLYIALDFFRDAPKVQMDWSKTPLELPTMPGSLEELQATLARIAKKLDKVPFDAIGEDLRRTMRTLDGTLKRTDKLLNGLDTEVVPEARATLEAARKALNTMEHTLSGLGVDQGPPLSQDVRETLSELTRAAQSLRTLTDYLERHPESLIRGKKEGEP